MGTAHDVKFPHFDLLGYVKERVRDARMSGAQLTMACINPECPDVDRAHKRRLWIRAESNTGWCYRCETLFDVPKFVMHYEQCSYRAALEFLGGKAHDEVYGSLHDARMKVMRKREKVFKPQKVDLPPGFIPIRTKVPKFARDRGLTLELCRKHKIGWCSSGKYANRLVIPVYYQGVRVSWVARAMWQVKEAAEGEDEKLVNKKVVNPKGVHTGAFLFNYDRVKQARTVMLVEGPFDAIALGDNAVALFGTHLSQQQYRLLVQTKAKKVVVLLDPDKAGRKAREEILDRLRGIFPEVTAPRIRCDPDELSAKELAAALAFTGKSSLSDLVNERLS